MWMLLLNFPVKPQYTGLVLGKLRAWKDCIYDIYMTNARDLLWTEHLCLLKSLKLKP